MSPETSDFSPSISQQMAEQQRAFDFTIQTNRLLALAAIINSALLLTGIFVAGLITGNGAAWKLSLYTMALCYLSPVVQSIAPEARRIAMTITGLSILFGGIALLLLVGWMP